MGESALANQLRLEVAQLTDVGRKREHNEDNMAYVIPKDQQVMAIKGALFIVADGMGGHAAGEVASEIAVDTVSNVYYMDDNEDVAGPLLQAIKRANVAIHQRAAENMLRSGMGTTCVAAVLRGNMAYIANVGDSRAYLIRQGQARQISQDHSWVAEQVRAGLLTEDQARTHAQRNVITRCLGTQADVDVDVFREQIQEGDTLVLCSDGLSGLVSDEELMRIVERSVPQESVYHLVERANENGGPDNITAIVVRVQEVGVEPPGARNPVYAGAREVSEEETAAFSMLSGLASSYTINSGDGRIVNGPLHLSSGPLAPPDSITAPQPALASERRSRLFFPTLLLVFLVIVALVGGGIFYVVHLNQDQAVTQSLASAGQLITRAQGEVNTNPSLALKDLAAAQSTLRDVQKNHQLNSDQSSQFNSLQSQMVTQVKAAIVQYNKTAKIYTLPCNNTTNTPINLPGPTTQASSLASVQYAKGTMLFTLGADGSLYQFSGQANSQFSLTKSLSEPAAHKFTAIASGGTQLFTLEQTLGANNVPNGYSLNMYQLDPVTGAPMQPISTPITSQLLAGGYIPSQVTAWGNHAYVVLSSQGQARIVFYAPDKTNHLVASAPFAVSISQPISSVAAFSNQFFIAFANGLIQSFPLTGVFSGQANPTTAPAVVLITAPIQLPLSTSQSTFSPSTTVPTVTPLGQKGSFSLMLSSAPMLSVGVVGTTTHLYIGDAFNHRILDLIPFTTASTNSANSATMQLEQQYVFLQYPSAQVTSSLKGMAVEPQGTTLNILVQPNTSSQVSLVKASTALQSGCSM
jgi:serine/threonine protein phosphatase PrpC